MRSRVSCVRATEKRGNVGSALVAALALTSLIFMTAILCLGRVAGSYSRMTMRHDQTNAMYLAEAGIQMAGQRLTKDRAYAGERGVRLASGAFDVMVTQKGNAYSVKSVGYADSPFRRKPRRVVGATITLAGERFRVSDWRENP